MTREEPVLSPATRSILRLLMLLIWLVAAFLALEFFERSRDLLGEHLAARFMKLQPPEPPFMRPATPEEQEKLRTQGTFPARAIARESTKADAPALEDAVESDETRFWRLYILPDIDEKQARATLEGEYWFLFDAAGMLEYSLGDPFLELAKGGGPGASQLQDFPLLASIPEGEARTIDDPSRPLWSYEIRRIHSTAPDGSGAKTIFLLRLLMKNPSLEDLADAYSDLEPSHLLVPDYICRPNYKEGGIITDQFGFVNHPVRVPKPAGVIRVVCIGGSTTHEDNPGGSRTTDFLQRFFDAQYPAGRVEIINCGIAGSGSNEMRRHARDYLKYEPDLILYYEGINDIVVHLNARNWQLPGWKHYLLKSSLLARWSNRELVLDDATFEDLWHGSTQRNLLAIHLAAQEAGVPMAGVSFAYAQKSDMSWQEANYIEFNARSSWGGGLATYDTVTHLLDLHNQYLKKLCEQQGMGYIPLAENFFHGMSHFKDLCHMTPVGMQERARILHAWLTPWAEEQLAAHPK